MKAFIIIIGILPYITFLLSGIYLMLDVKENNK